MPRCSVDVSTEKYQEYLDRVDEKIQKLHDSIKPQLDTLWRDRKFFTDELRTRLARRIA